MTLPRAWRGLLVGAVASPPLTLNAWLRYDIVDRVLRSGSPSRSLLEIGAGEGALGTRLARRFRYTGLEADERSCRTAQQRLRSLGDADVIAGDEGRLPAGARFDVVCAFEVIEHIEDDVEALRRWHSLLHPGGLLVLSTPAHQHRFGPWDELVGHYRRYDRNTLATRLAEAGFTAIRMHSYGFPLGYALETARNLLASRQTHSGSMENRTAVSGRLLQPSPALGSLTWTAALPFRIMQRPFAQTSLGTGVVAWARHPA